MRGPQEHYVTGPQSFWFILIDLFLNYTLIKAQGLNSSNQNATKPQGIVPVTYSPLGSK